MTLATGSTGPATRYGRDVDVWGEPSERSAREDRERRRFNGYGHTGRGMLIGFIVACVALVWFAGGGGLIALPVFVLAWVVLWIVIPNIVGGAVFRWFNPWKDPKK